ncbi:MAG: glycoside hydrolase family 15 protein [Zoogloea sp.]|nr:glycoside hydrolase family 15 protein [Zoogloea sp.]
MSDACAMHPLLKACGYEPIADYALIGNCRTGALVSRNGSIDWLCLPHFSAPSVFGALLDRARGGRLLVRPRDIVKVERRYAGNSAVLETSFHCASGSMRLTDAMPVPAGSARCNSLVRLAECLAGSVCVDVIYQPRPDYGRSVPGLRPCGGNGWLFMHGGHAVLFQSDAALSPSGPGLVAGTHHLQAGSACRFALLDPSDAERTDAGLDAVHARLAETRRWWEAWYGQCTYRGDYAAAVVRSCLTLKLLTYQPSGAVMAALTTSLPESLSAARNWDYRYCWLRDTSLLEQSFIGLGFRDESEDFLHWLLHVRHRPRLQPLYDLAGELVPDERTLAHLEGYRKCGPVRVGNSAHRQLQLDIYGELVQTAYRFATRGGRLDMPEKRFLAAVGRAVCRLWREPDQSIWEARTPPRHYTYSSLMCWVALDRLIALHQEGILDIDVGALRQEREQIRSAIDSRGFNAELGSYVGYFGGHDPDASLLLMTRYRYLPTDDPRMAGTYRHIMNRLSTDGLLFRYPPGGSYDGVDGAENLFAVCNFWAVDYLARAGKVDEAARLFERLLDFANDVGLYAEQFGVESREPWGNFPQAFSHSGLVTAALALEQARAGKRGHQIAS